MYATLLDLTLPKRNKTKRYDTERHKTELLENGINETVEIAYFLVRVLRKAMEPFEKKSFGRTKCNYYSTPAEKKIQKQNTATEKMKKIRWRRQKKRCPILEIESESESERERYGVSRKTQMEIPAYKRVEMNKKTGIDFFSSVLHLLELIVGFME